MENKLPSPILITGAARSGTSLTAGIINICGAFGGQMSGPNKNNPKGMFENAAIRNNILKPYLRWLGVDHLGQYPLPDVNNMTIPNDWRARVEQVFMNEGYQSGPCFYKGAKMALTWPVWDYAFPDAKWIIVRRKTGDIVRSCINTGFMAVFGRTNFQKAVGVKTELDGWIWWVNQHLKRFQEMEDAGLNIKTIWPDKLINSDYGQIRKIVEWLGLEYKRDEIKEFIDPLLWNARTNSCPVCKGRFNHRGFKSEYFNITLCSKGCHITHKKKINLNKRKIAMEV